MDTIESLEKQLVELKLKARQLTEKYEIAECEVEPESIAHADLFIEWTESILTIAKEAREIMLAITALRSK